MQLVIADTGPVNYLILIGHIDILPVLFEKVILPAAVQIELTDLNTPLPVPNWIAAHPSWVEVRHTANPVSDVSLAGLGDGEIAAITLALELHSDLLLMDDRRGVIAALHKGIAVTDTGTKPWMRC